VGQSMETDEIETTPPDDFLRLFEYEYYKKTHKNRNF